MIFYGDRDYYGDLYPYYCRYIGVDVPLSLYDFDDDEDYWVLDNVEYAVDEVPLSLLPEEIWMSHGLFLSYKTPTGVCPYCLSEDIIENSDGRCFCSDCMKSWKYRSVQCLDTDAELFSKNESEKIAYANKKYLNGTKPNRSKCVTDYKVRRLIAKVAKEHGERVKSGKYEDEYACNEFIGTLAEK